MCKVWGHPVDNHMISEIQNDEGYINLQRGTHPYVPRHSETLTELEGDYAVQEGDLLLSSDRNAVSDLWPQVDGNVSIPYKIDFELADRTDVILKALKMISEKTCIRFHQHINEMDYLLFSYSKGCASYVGCVGGEQPVLIGPPCGAGNICHEVLHSLGLHHEHSRHDRGDHITILYENISPGKESNFAEKVGDTLGLQYDLGSLLHYGAYYFSSNGKPTIVAKNSRVQIGQRTHMSDLDVKKIRKLYHCGTFILSAFNMDIANRDH
ncbi:astacin-like metalloendopeptidase [Myxocyprinus asiaticus]|uniref:astacin-like metalloendopeptidase n=1 Tax=Myxocyprinus asiaticus TaxID=70543 RepID=UPI002222CE57|nr:astacin-like metalloendopeptidase [Myxocyprinus asiaticus]